MLCINFLLLLFPKIPCHTIAIAYSHIFERGSREETIREKISMNPTIHKTAKMGMLQIIEMFWVKGQTLPITM